jgi:hypothetical protein
MRVCSLSGLPGPSAWSSIAATAISTISVKLMPKMLMKVKNFRRNSTFIESSR